MLSRLGYYADKVIEWGWLGAVILVPLFFNVYSSRVFEPDKISTLRSLVLIMLVAWLIKLFEGGYRGASKAGITNSRGGKVATAVKGAAESALPPWLGFLRVPMVIPVLVYALAYLISTIFTITPDATIWGSYQRLQGTYSQYSYMMLGFLLIANLRTRAQLERLINFILLTSLPVALYGLLQAARLDPLPWAGDTSTRVASTMGNAIFVAAWLIMVVPLALYRLFSGVSASLAARHAAPVEAEPDPRAGARASRRNHVVEVPSYGWAAVTNSVGVLFIESFIFYFVLKIMAGLPFPDARVWPALPAALLIFYFGCWAIEWFGKKREDPALAGIYMPIIGAGVFLSALFAFVLSWTIDRNNTQNGLITVFSIDGGGLLWVLFFSLLWGAIATGVYALTAGERAGQLTHPDGGIVRLALNVGYGLLLFVQLLCIYLSQSRGPWIGLGVGLLAFAVAIWLLGRSRGVRWMARVGGTVSTIALVLALFVGALNIPGSPLKFLDSVPVLGRGIERLSTLTQGDEGTGKVRTLIWEGATQLILSDPMRAIIGWGPEAMYVAYNRFYPAELAQVELRNATPDRSHNVEFDQVVTIGVLGLLAYYFLLGAFFFYALRLLKRLSNTRDQLFVVALISVITAHFVEIQTGIQIASTWTYFYLTLGMLVAFGYFLTGALRPLETSTSAELAPGATVQAGALASTVQANIRSAAGSAREREARVALAEGGNGKASGSAGVQAKLKGSQPQPPTRNGANGRQHVGTAGAQARDNRQDVGGRRRQTMQAQAARGASQGGWLGNPVMLVVYVLATVAALFAIFGINSATVRADTLYKQGLSYDQAQRWPESIDLYTQAINIQPNQDYYYLFLGRSWLEFAKSVDQEKDDKGNPVNYRLRQPYKNAADKDAERLFRLQNSEAVLQRALALNPRNTDHYANLGRLYLYWADATGGKDPSKAPLAVKYMEESTQSTPGNAQLWDELAVAYTRNSQFTKAVDALTHSQNDVDPTFAQTPMIRGQLFQERAQFVKNALQSGTPLPTDGETDYGKLLIEAGKAFSDTIKLDASQFTDAQYTSRIDSLIEASQPFTATNTKVDATTVRNVLTNTVMSAYQFVMQGREDDVTSFVRSHGGYTGSDPRVPDATLQSLIQDKAWVSVNSDGSRQWRDTDFRDRTHNAALPHAALGYIYSKVNRGQEALQNYQRALSLEPGNQLAQQGLQALQGQK